MLENGIASEISFQSGYSQGIFLDQRDNRAEVRRLIAPGKRILNTFAYTGAFSVAAGMAGATPPCPRISPMSRISSPSG